MRVKRLEVQGFKSFKDKTVIHFDHNITGIVGPNGCGKSNVVDAFFWVMGEQSYKHIRGTGAEDLIFNGSSKYQPLPYAEATLVMETDVVDSENAPSGASSQDIPLHLKAKEISVTRRVYRTGEGEYFINGVQTRLKDIHELFMDTGVGAKGYSIIEQGQIGKIVNAKPEDRRVLIEEAAGIAKYKARKKESLRKIEAAHANLSRLNDVISEIERSMNSLERQAQKASQYKRIKEELLDKEMTWGRRKNLVLKTQIAELKIKRETLEQELVGLKAELATTEANIETDRTAQLTLSKNAEELQSRVNLLSGDLTRAQSSLELSRRRQNDLSTQLETLSAEKTDLITAIESEKQAITHLESENANASQVNETAIQAVNAQDLLVRDARVLTEDLRKALDFAKRELLTGLAQSADLNSRAAALDSRLESISQQVAKLTLQAQSFEQKVSTLKEQTQFSQKAIAETQSVKIEIQSAVESAQNQKDALELALKESRKNCDLTLGEYTKIQSKLQSLEELNASLEGYGDGPKSILEWARANGFESNFKTLAESFEVTPGYELALEGFFEGKLESLVTDDPKLALQTLKNLKNDSKGRASIQLAQSLQSITPLVSKSQIQNLLESAGFKTLGALSQFITNSTHLFDGVMVVESMDALLSFYSMNGLEKIGSWSIVSLDGTALDSNGFLRGGSVNSDKTSSILGRKRAIAELQEQSQIALQTHKNNESKLTEITKQLELTQQSLNEKQLELQNIEIKLGTQNAELEQMERTLKENVSQFDMIQYEVADLKNENELALNDRKQVSSQIDLLLASKVELENQISNQELEYQNSESHLREQETKLSDLRIQAASIAERANSMKRELEAGLNLIRDRERRLADVERALVRAQTENETHTGGDIDFLTQITEITQRLSQERQQLSDTKNDLSIVSTKVNDALSKMKVLHSQGDSKTAEVNQHALDLERMLADLSHLVQNLEEKYGPGCLETPSVSPIQEEMTEPVVTLEMSAEEEKILAEDVERLRERIRRLGDVNPAAVEEFEEQKKRFDYLTTEKNDLLKSIDNLNEAIEHINKTSEERFKKAFNAIADRFERLFPIIFGGGQAKLSLVYPEGSTDILDAGVDILAQPPGKKIVNIGLLSGGEKALTAVSLIFAIFMVKPSPFCILDEVDAPLDDANIGKFNALLREMSSKSQFIIITHNKKTMELNDTLYGVTMEEPGVSKMVNIEMR